MSFFTALLDYSGARNQAKAQAQQTAYEDALQQKQLGIDEQNAQTQNALSQAQLQQYQQALQQQNRNRQFEAGLQLPKNFGTMQPDQRIAYLIQRANAAERMGDQDVIKNTMDQINSLELGAERLANANYTAGAKTNLTNAQAGWWKQRHSEVMAQLAQRERTAGAALRGAMARAQLSANTRLQTAGMSNDEREFVAAQTALNVANRMNEQEAFNAAMAQYKMASTAWQKQESNYQLGIGSNPGNAPTPQQFIISAPQAATPQVMVFPITLPNGQTMNANVVTSGNANADQPPVSASAQQAISFARDAMLHHGKSAASIVQTLGKMVHSGQLSPADQQTVLRALFSKQ